MLIAAKEMIKETSEKYRAATKVLTHETDIIIVLDWLLVGHINSETRPDKVSFTSTIPPQQVKS